VSQVIFGFLGSRRSLNASEFETDENNIKAEKNVRHMYLSAVIRIQIF
jgi:hypothetical protein